MVKKIFVLLLLIFLILPLVSSVQIDSKSEVNQGETLNIKISGTFLEPIQEDNIYFYRVYNTSFVGVPFEFDLIKIDGDYYLSISTFGKFPGNYSVTFKDLEYVIVGGETSDTDLVVNFFILEDFASFSTIPGVLIAENSFSVKIQNLKDTESTINVQEKISTEIIKDEEKGFFSSLFGGKNTFNQLNSSQKSITMKAGETKNFEFELDGVNESSFKTFLFTDGNFSQEVWVYALENLNDGILEKKNLEFEIDFSNISLAQNSNTTRIWYLINSGNSTFENVTFEISASIKDYVSIFPLLIEDFESNETEKITLEIVSKNETLSVNGTITAKTSDDVFAYSEIYLNIIEDYIPIIENPIVQNKSFFKTCTELGGKICSQKTKCSNQTQDSSSGACCLSECVEKEKKTTSMIIGIVILLILIILYGWFYFKKYKKAKNKTDLLKIAEKEDEY